MFSNLSVLGLGILLFSLGFTARAENSQSTFEIIDLSGEVSGEPELGMDVARTSWVKACTDWKRETRELNKTSEMIFINCNAPSCSNLENGKSLCTSMGSYKIKSSGVRVSSRASNPEPVAPPIPTAPPAVLASPVIIANPSPVYVQTIPSLPPPVWSPHYWHWIHVYRDGWHRHRRPGIHIEYSQY